MMNINRFIIIFVYFAAGWALHTEKNVDRGEAFSGAWLGHVSHVMENPDIAHYESGKIFLGNRRIACEEASWAFFYSISRKNGVTAERKQSYGSYPHFTVDTFDFSVYHLSTLERLVKGGWRKNMGDVSNALTSFRRVYSQTNMHQIAQAAMVDPQNRELTRMRESTVVIVPFIITKPGRGNSRQQFRKEYLDLMFWSLYAIFPKIVFAVKYESDRDFVLQHKYPVWDTLVLNDLGGDCHLPLAAIVEARKCLKGLPCRSKHDWTKEGFKLMYFTEGDQILSMRDAKAVLEWAMREENRLRVLLPHRLVLPTKSFLKLHNKQGQAADKLTTFHDIHTHSCCLDTGDYGYSRIHWKHVSDPAVNVVNIFGVDAILGHSNFWSQRYRTCNVTSPRHACPENPVAQTFNRNRSLEYFSN